MAIDAEGGEELEHLLQLGDVGLLVHRGVGGDLVAEDLGHADGEDALLEDALAFDNEVMGELQAVHVDVPVVPLAGADDDLGAGLGLGVADRLGLGLGDQLLAHEALQDGLGGGRIGGGEVVAHLLPHEDAIGADVHHAPLGMEAGDEFLDAGVDEGLAAADGDHGRVALGGDIEALVQGDDVLDGRGVLADAAAARAGEVARVQRLQLQHHGELGAALEAVGDDVTGDLGGRREGETHGGRGAGSVGR